MKITAHPDSNAIKLFTAVMAVLEVTCGETYSSAVLTQVVYGPPETICRSSGVDAVDLPLVIGDRRQRELMSGDFGYHTLTQVIGSALVNFFKISVNFWSIH